MQSYKKRNNKGRREKKEGRRKRKGERRKKKEEKRKKIEDRRMRNGGMGYEGWGGRWVLSWGWSWF